MPGGTRSQLGNGLFEQILYLPSVAVPNVAANATSSQAVTVPGALPGDLISWNQQGVIAGLSVDNVYVSAVNTLSFFWSNTTVAAINGSANQPFLICVLRGENTSLGLLQMPNSVT